MLNSAGRYLSFIILGSPLPFFASVWLRTSQSLLGDQWISGELSVLLGSGTHPSLDQFVLHDIGSTYWQWLVGLVCPQKRHSSCWEHWVEWPWHLLWSCVQSVAPMVAKRTCHSGAGDSQTPGWNILVVGGWRHLVRVVEELVEWLVVVESGEWLYDDFKTTLGFIA